MVKNITFAAIWLLLCASRDQAQRLPPIPPIVYRPILEKTAEVYNTSRVLTRSGRSPLQCSTDLKAVLNDSLDGCFGRVVKSPKRSNYTQGAVIDYRVDPSGSEKQINYQESTLPVQDKPAALSFTHTSVHMSFTSTSTVEKTVDPIYPPDNVRHFKEGRVVVEIKVRNGKLKSVNLLEPALPVIDLTSDGGGVRSQTLAIVRSNRMFADAVLQAIQKWTFKPGEDSYFKVLVKFSIE